MSPALIWAHTVWPLLVALVVGLSVTGIGLSLLKATGRGRGLSGLEIALALPLGFAVAGYVADLVFMTGNVDMRPVYRVEVLIGFVLFVWHARTLRVQGATMRASWVERALWTVGWAVVVWFAAKLVVGNITPISDGDSFYHYALYSQSLSAGVTFNEILLLKNFPLADLNRIIQHVYATAGTLGGVGALHLMNFWFIVGIALIAQAVSVDVLKVSRWANPLPVLAVLSIREIVYTGYSAKLDYGVAVLELTALMLWLTWRDRRSFMLAVGLGIALCARTNSLRFAAVIPLIWLIDQWWHRREDGGTRAIVVRTLAVGCGVALVAAPPYVMQYVIYGNPVFPMFNDIFGHYRHYYEWTLLDTLRYRTEYGWFGAVVVYAYMALSDWMPIPGVVLPPNTPYGLSVLLLLVPLAFRRSRATLWLLGFVALGYLTWYAQAHTHRTLLSVAVIAVVLGAAAISRLSRPFVALRHALFVGVVGLTAWSASGFLGFNSLGMNYFYVCCWPTSEYHDTFLPRVFAGRVLPAADLDAIYAIVGDAHLAAVNLAPFSDPRLIRTRRLHISTRSMAAIEADEAGEQVDRAVARELLASEYLTEQARQIEARLWPADGQQRPLEGGADFHWYLTASYDTMQHVGDALLADPARLAPLLRFEGVKYFLAPATSVYGSERVSQLTEVWRSDTAILLRVEPR
jgi:hypothetical protein